jgi:hypothetical protein
MVARWVVRARKLGGLDLAIECYLDCLKSGDFPYWMTVQANWI